MAQDRKAKILTWSATDTTVGACSLTAVNYAGSAAASTLTILDGTAIKLVIPIAITSGGYYVYSPPIAFSNLVTDMTGTAGYSVSFVPSP